MSSKNSSYFAISILIIGLAIGIILFKSYDKSHPAALYNPVIVPSEFTTEITNKFFALPVDKEFTYQGMTTEGLEKNVVRIESGTKKIMGVDTVIYRDKVWLDGVLIEDTRDYLAQDKDGNVWYFGEDVDNYEDGKLVDHDGSWIAGERGGKPGIWLKADNQPGDSYKQEYLKGEAEDITDVKEIGLNVTTQYHEHTGCIKMYDWTPLEQDARENKYYCQDVGGIVMSEDLVTGEKMELVSVTIIPKE